MDNKIAGIIAVCAVVIVMGGAILALSLGGFEVSNDNDYVIYDGNGQKTTNGETSMKSTSTEVLGGNLFDATSKYFLIWNTKADGTGTSYVPSSEVKLGTKLYAIWGDHKLEAMQLGLKAILNGLTLGLSDDISGADSVRTITFPAGLSNKGEVTIVISGWTTVEKVGDYALSGTTPYGSASLSMTVEGATSSSLSVSGNNAYLKITYSGDVTVS
jgi:hypothetical protein